MKKVFISIIVAIVIALGFSSCTKEDYNNYVVIYESGVLELDTIYNSDSTNWAFYHNPSYKIAQIGNNRPYPYNEYTLQICNDCRFKTGRVYIDYVDRFNFSFKCTENEIKDKIIETLSNIDGWCIEPYYNLIIQDIENNFNF